MALSRPVAGALSATLVTALAWPLERQKVLRQCGVRGSTRDGWRDGWLLATGGAACGSWAHFSIYEGLLRSGRPVLLAATAAGAASATVLAPTSTLKRRALLRAHVPSMRTLDSRALRDAYVLTLVRELPRTAVKHALYEWALRLLPLEVRGAVRGALAAAAATTCVTVAFCPLDWARTQLAARASVRDVRQLVRRDPACVLEGLPASIAHALCSNVCGYALLEHLAPRVTP